MPLREATDLIDHAIEEERKEKFFRIWLVRYSTYDKNNFESFEEFYDKHTPQRVTYDTRSKNAIMQDIKKIEGREE